MKTQNNRKKRLTKTISYLSFSLFLILISCKSDDTPTDCGCHSEIINTISENTGLIGKLFYKNSNTGNNYNNYKYWIVYVEQNCTNCIHSMIVCNENILSNINNIPELNKGAIFNSITELDDALDVQFSGHLKEICNPIFHPADYTYENITLTNIEQQ